MKLAAINMAVGAAYAGGRPIVTTSGRSHPWGKESASQESWKPLRGGAPRSGRGLQREWPPGRNRRTWSSPSIPAMENFQGRSLVPGTMEGAFEIAQRAFRTAEKFRRRPSSSLRTSIS